VTATTTPALVRLPDWQLRYAAFARERMGMRFVWGVNDCAIFALDAVEAMTGQRQLQHLRDYSTAYGAARRQAANDGLAGIATLAFGAPVPPRLARIGDVVLVFTGGRESLAICNGGTAMGPGPDGTVHIGMGAARAAWRVG
jgi:hypothetical protein